LAAEAFDVLAGGDQQRAGVAGGDRDSRGPRRCRGGEESLELAVEQLDLGVEIDHSARERPQRRFGGVDGFVQPRLVGAKLRAERRPAARVVLRARSCSRSCWGR